MSELTRNEVIERYDESLKRAASSCRMLAVSTKNNTWRKIADGLDAQRIMGVKMASQTQVSKTDLDAQIDRHKAKMVKK